MKADAHAFILEEGERDGFLDEQKGNKIVVIFTKDFCFKNKTQWYNFRLHREKYI